MGSKESNGAAPQVLYSVVVPNWCGGEMLVRGLHAIFKEARLERARDAAWTFETIVCDDASPGGEVARLRAAFPEAEYPELRLIARERNEGFGPTVNEGCAAARGAILCLCNNDLLPERGYFRGLLEPLVAGHDLLYLERVAGGLAPFGGATATSAYTEDPFGTPNHACMRGAWRGGRMRLYYRTRPLPGAAEGEPMAAHFLQAGAAAVRVGAWRALGGMNDLFAPGYWEDYDFSHRLRRAGGTILYTPAARAFHLGKASMARRHGPGRVRDLMERNRLIFEALHAPEDQRGAAQRLSVARDIAAEWLRGGPFHRTRGLRLFRRLEPATQPPPPQQPEAVRPEALYPANDLEHFLPSP